MKKFGWTWLSITVVFAVAVVVLLVLYLRKSGDKGNSAYEREKQIRESENMIERVHNSTATSNGIRGSLKQIELLDILQFPEFGIDHSDVLKIRKTKIRTQYGYDYGYKQSPLARTRLTLYNMIKNAKHRLTIVNMVSPFVSLISDEFLAPIAAGLRDRKAQSKLKMLIVLGDMHTLIRLGAGIIKPKLRMSYVLNKLPKGNHEIAFVLQNDMSLAKPLSFLLWNHSKYVIADGGERVMIGGMNFWSDYDDLEYYKKKGASDVAQTPVIDMMLSLRCNASELSHMAYMLAEKAMKYNGIIHDEINEQVKFKSMKLGVEDQQNWLKDYTNFEQRLCKAVTLDHKTIESRGYFVCKKYPAYFLKNYLAPDTVEPNPSRTAMYAAMKNCKREFCIDGQQVLSQIDRFFTDIEEKSREALKNIFGSEIVNLFPTIFNGIHSPRLMAYDRNNILRNIANMLNRGVNVKILNSPHTDIGLEYSNDAPVKDLIRELVDLGASQEGLDNLQVKYVRFENGHIACQHSKNWFADRNVCYVGSENSYSSTLHQSGVIFSGDACRVLYIEVFKPKWERGLVCNFRAPGTPACEKIIVKA